MTTGLDIANLTFFTDDRGAGLRRALEEGRLVRAVVKDDGVRWEDRVAYLRLLVLERSVGGEHVEVICRVPLLGVVFILLVLLYNLDLYKTRRCAERRKVKKLQQCEWLCVDDSARGEFTSSNTKTKATR